MPELTEKQKVNNIFRELRKLGYTAKQGFSCCGTCAGYEIGSMFDELGVPDERRKTFFYSRQGAKVFDGKNFKRGFYNQSNKKIPATLYVNWDGNAEEIISVIHKHGLKAVWEGKDSYCIGITVEVG